MTNIDEIQRPPKDSEIRIWADVLSDFNGGFEDDVDGDNPSQWYDDEIAGTWDIKVDDSKARTGTKSLNFIKTAGATVQRASKKAIGFADHLGLELNHIVKQGIPIIPGYSYLVEGYGWMTNSFSLKLGVGMKFWSGGSVIPFTELEKYELVTAVGPFSQWVRVFQHGIAPAGAKTMAGICYAESEAPFGNFWIDDVALWVPIGVCQKFAKDEGNGLIDILEWGTCEAVDFKETVAIRKGSFENAYFDLTAYGLAIRRTDGSLPKTRLRIAIYEGSEAASRVFVLNNVKIDKKSMEFGVGSMAMEKVDFKYTSEVRSVEDTRGG